MIRAASSPHPSICTIFVRGLGGRFFFFFFFKHFLSLGQAQGSRAPRVLGGGGPLLRSHPQPHLRAAAMARMNRPAPVEVSYKNMRFLITHNPTNATLSSFIEVSIRHASWPGWGPASERRAWDDRPPGSGTRGCVWGWGLRAVGVSGVGSGTRAA